MTPPRFVVSGDEAAPIGKAFRSGHGMHLLVVPHSRIFDIDSGPSASNVDRLPPALVAALANTVSGEEPLEYVAEPAPQSLSLNVSSSCNLSCSYCYADRGSFGSAQPQPMTWEVAQRAIDTLLRDADREAPITIGFLGGEPFVNRPLIHRAVEYAVTEGRRLRLDVRFSVTTNGTLLTADDVALFRRHPFAVTVSIDGGEQIQNAQRPLAGQSGSFALVRRATRSLLADPGSVRVAARATVKAGAFDLSERLEAIAHLGFHEIGFAPLRAARPGAGAFTDDDWIGYLDAMVEVGKSELSRARDVASLRLSNLAVALKQLYRGASSPYPCGAGVPPRHRFRRLSHGQQWWLGCERSPSVCDFAPCALAGAVPPVLGTLPLFGRMPSGSGQPQRVIVRIYSRLARVLPRRVL
jgi:uncharacterized protein